VAHNAVSNKKLTSEEYPFTLWKVPSSIPIYRYRHVNIFIKIAQ